MLSLPSNVFQSQGIWTPTDQSGAGLVFTGVNCAWTRTGNMVNAYGRFTFPVTGNGAANIIGGLPFVLPNVTYAELGSLTATTIALCVALQAQKNTSNFLLLKNTGAQLLNSECSAGAFWFNINYPVS